MRPLFLPTHRCFREFLSLAASLAGLGLTASAVFADSSPPDPFQSPAAASSPTTPPTNTPASTPGDQQAPRYYIFPISDALQSYPLGYDAWDAPDQGKLSFAEFWLVAGLVDASDPGHGVVSAINNHNDILFRSGDIYQLTGSAMVWKYRAWGTAIPNHYASDLQPDVRPQAKSGGILNQITAVPGRIAPLTAIAIDDADDVMGT